MAEGGIAIVLKSLKALPRNLVVQEQGVCLLRNMAIGGHRRALVSAGVQEALMNVKKRCPPESNVFAHASELYDELL